MIYFLYGDNTAEVNKKASGLVADLLKKKPDASFFTLNDENWNASTIDEYISSQGLFENKYVVHVKNAFSGDGGSAAEKKARKEEFLEKIELFAESPNIFIIAEGAVDKASLKKIEKHSQKVQEFSKGEKGEVGKGKKAAGDGFKVFDLADALGSRDKKTLWTLYRQAVEAGKASEEIHGILFWQVKSMAIAIRTKTAEESGLNPYVFSKSQRHAANFSHDEIASMQQQLVSIYHDAHRGLHDFETALEVFILEKI